ncbi:hypothetical protein ODZ83_05510 [Acaricomes phytoseiuli]|uniref:hypothetical protein n=1 Tax=Acaricomes phytoseiuli TaxID=291968 RepID=UPI0022221B51|nr:hypothetical protein [Acaricomes phytoseiuli]MCW1249648.1 hypothetical protein [Acaricomes phytoseiuli]
MTTMSDREWLEKAYWEVGVFEAVTSYGLGSKNLTPGPLHDYVKQLEEALPPVLEALARIDDYAEDLGVDGW